MAKKRKYRPFTPEEIVIINAQSGLVSIAELAKIVDINYTSLTVMLNSYRRHHTFLCKPKTKKVMKRDYLMVNKHLLDDKGQVVIEYNKKTKQYEPIPIYNDAMMDQFQAAIY